MAESEIPADLMAKARTLADDAVCFGYTQAVLDISQALLAERERCAKIAEEDCRTALAIEHDYKPTWYVRAQQIAAAIRQDNPNAPTS